MKNKKNDSPFYNVRGTVLMISIVILIAVLSLIGMYSLGVISLPSFIKDFIEKPEETFAPLHAANIAPESGTVEYHEALPREEYAKALVDIEIPSEYYRNYSVTILSGNTAHSTDYVSIYKNGDWWVQAKENDVIVSTTVCKDGTVRFSSNADNTHISTSAEDFTFYEYIGYTPLEELTSIIYSLANGNDVDYAGGISDFSLSYTPARGTGDNLFSFYFTRKDGFSEEYTFALESATILSAKKFNSAGEKIYQMEMKDSRNNLDKINVDSLLIPTNND